MSEVEKILNKLDDNKVEVVTIEDEEQEPTKVAVSLVTKAKIIQEFLEGKSKKDIGNSYNISTRAVSIIIEKNDELRHETEIKHRSTALARENYRLSETKDKLIGFIDDTLQEVKSNPDSMTTEAKLKVLNNVAAIFDKLAITARLNEEKPTNITENRHIKADLSEIMKELKTPEDKLNFLRNQNSPGKIDKPIYDGEIISTKE